jgi:acyl-CoA thioester hydrolase
MTVHRQRVRVRYGETDQMGYAHHSVYLLWFEEGRTGLMRGLGRPYSVLEKEGTILPVTEAALHFRAPARYEEELDVEARVAEVTGVRVRFTYRVLHLDGTLAADGHTVLASCGADGRPKRMPADLAAVLRSAISAGEAAS